VRDELTMLEAKHLAKKYNDGGIDIDVLKDINLTVEKGELVTISGQSGCGKSTLLHILGLLDDADAGELLLNGVTVNAHQHGITSLRNQLLGFVFQFHYLMEDLTAMENVALPLIVKGESTRHSLLKAQDLLDLVGLTNRKDHYPHQLSGGEQQRVALCRAIINSPQIILADEPTGNLDPYHKDEVLSLLLQLNREMQFTFILVTHDTSIAQISHTHYLLENGILQKQPN